MEIEKGSQLKQYLHEQKIMYQDINRDTTELAVLEMDKAIKSIGIENYDLDNFKDTNLQIYNYEENHYRKTKKYKLLSLLCAALLDLGLNSYRRRLIVIYYLYSMN